LLKKITAKDAKEGKSFAAKGAKAAKKKKSVTAKTAKTAKGTKKLKPKNAEATPSVRLAGERAARGRGKSFSRGHRRAGMLR
jgi:hypothetical protein